ncbi:hypothetical protein FEM48_Zijuj09G0035000 [Ziziphus jujuba var. spinosa]|uniref:HMA domain-containing protein n=1 Tax=Ziziphus jujuba var. spinosa TaxID=714518 RepID=A0A978UQM9_ZIZJJ|nr:hypothetical protein FEM48_Zijuj09G0035000 [Ziziphus jujuba var. spinosa]
MITSIKKDFFLNGEAASSWFGMCNCTHPFLSLCAYVCIYIYVCVCTYTEQYYIIADLYSGSRSPVLQGMSIESKKKVAENYWYLNFGCVNSITIDVEKGTIAVAGEVDPPTIINAISKLGKRSELSSFQKNPTTTATNVSKKPQSNTSPGSKKPDQQAKKNVQTSQANKSQKGGTNRDCGCHGDDSDSDSDDDDEDHDHHNNKNKGHHNGHAPHRPKGINAPPPHPMYNSHHNNIIYSNGYFSPVSLPYQSMARPYVGYGSGHHHYFRPAMFGRPPPPLPVVPPYGHGSYQLPMAPPPPPPLPRPPPMYGYHNQQQREPPVGNSVLHLFSDDNTSTEEACCIM